MGIRPSEQSISGSHDLLRSPGLRGTCETVGGVKGIENGDDPGCLRLKPQFLHERASQKQAEFRGSTAQALGLFLHLLANSDASLALWIV